MAQESNINIHILQKNVKGELANMYSPLQNLVSESTGLIGDMTTEKLEFDRYNPVELSITDEYDGSTNIILNDDKHNPKLVNTRFSVQENNTYNIPIHSGNNVTNIYDEATFGEDAQLLKLYKSIPTLYFKGLYNGGSFKCGSYVFYFKLSDSDGNLTNTVQESGIVQVHIGQPGSSKIRMGMQDENSEKCIKFKLTDIDSGFDYVRIFYERVSTDESQATVNNYFMIDQNFPILDNECEILLTGSEPSIACAKSDLNNEFADIQTAKTQAIVDTTLFLGNVSAYEQNYQELQKIAWSIIPSAVPAAGIGSIACNKYKRSDSNLYYDASNSYYYVGYWPDEIYRFGIVFIYNNNLLSPVFNIQGCDLLKVNENNIKEIFFKDERINSSQEHNYKQYTTEPEDYFFKKEYFTNSKGVVKFPKWNSYKTQYQNMITPSLMAVKFDFNYIGGVRDDRPNPSDVLRKNNIKGFFFVRQKRIPTIITQGMVIGLTGKDYGSIPVLRNGLTYVTKSFLDKHRLLRDGSTVQITSDVEKKALLVPDYEVDLATLNQFFNGSEFYLDKVASTVTGWYGDSCVVNGVINYEEDLHSIAKLTAVPKQTKITTDGENYFSTLAGIMDEPYKTADVNLKWNKTKPQDLTTSTSLIRGQWGSYVGMSTDLFEYGDIINVKIPECGNYNWEDLEFQKRFKDYSFYSAISPRQSIDQLDRSGGDFEICYRGDCFFNIFTHRMMSNFIDGELPTNTKIVDPSCWATNYAVRCTAQILTQTHSNLTADSDGWYIPSPNDNTSNTVSLIFGILTGNIGTIVQAAKQMSNKKNEEAVLAQTEFANEIAQAFEIKIDDKVPVSSTVDDLLKNGEGQRIKKVNPKEQETSGGFNLKSIFKSDDKWELHGLASINRSDVNAVSFGQWITFPIQSNYNLALRDIDFSHATEEASMNRKRAFYPWEDMNPENHMLESETINGAAKRTLSSNGQPAYTTLPYIKQEYFNRIYWSKPNVTQQFINSYRMIFKDQYHEYNKEFGAITKLVPITNGLLVVFQHGIGILPVNRTPQSEQEQSPFLSSKSVLPTQVSPITRDYGSMWKDSVIKTPSGMIYGVDTVAKKIWRTNGQNLEFISDHKVSKFLNDWIDLSEYDFNEYVGHINVKTHYNEFKHDVIFTYYKDIPLDSEGKEVDLSGNLVLEDTEDPKSKIVSWKKGTTWSLCYNEVTQQFITFYDWYPIESCNIDNIFFSFDKEVIDDVYNNESERSVDLLSGNSNFESFIQNKVFLDKMFGENTRIYKCKEETNITLLNISNGYLSFYYKQPKRLPQNHERWDNIITGGEVFELGKDKEWKFFVLRNNSAQQLELEIPENYLISELHYTTTDNEIDGRDPVLKFSELREGFVGPSMYLWKHGQAGLYDNQGKIKPTHWYGKQHEFNVEFVVNQDAQIQKIFNNLKIISNKTAPNKFEYEIVGEGYDWFDLKPVILWINKKVPERLKELQLSNPNKTEKDAFESLYIDVLTLPYDDGTNNCLRYKFIDFPELFGYEGKTIKKIPFLHLETCDKYGRQDKSYHQNKPDFWGNLDSNKEKDEYSFNTSEVILVEDDQLNEQRVHTESLGNDIRKYGRLRGNMQYLEDLWDIEIRPIKFNWAYVNEDDELLFAPSKEARHRDKYIKIKVRYTGKDLAVIQGIITMFDYSMA